MAKITLSNIRPFCSAPSDDLLPGVKKMRRKFQAWISLSGKNSYIGSYSTNLEAGIAWLEAKVKRDTDYLKEFEENLLSDKVKLEKLKANQLRESQRVA